MQKNPPIGVIDSGVGGLTVLYNLQELMPDEQFLYLGDCKNTPYGTRSRSEIIKLVKHLTDWLARKNIKQLVVGCNTVTALGTDVIRGSHSFSVIGMSTGADLAVKATKTKRIGIMATDFTVHNGKHEKYIKALDNSMQVYWQACPKLVTLIEKEAFESPELTAAVKQYTDNFIKNGVDTILLSCTHFPFVKKQIEQAVGKHVKVIDPALQTARNSLNDLQNKNSLCTKPKAYDYIYFTADADRGERLAKRIIKSKQCHYGLTDLLLK